jgi:hypothetical protein
MVEINRHGANDMDKRSKAQILENEQRLQKAHDRLLRQTIRLAEEAKEATEAYRHACHTVYVLRVHKGWLPSVQNRRHVRLKLKRRSADRTW